MTFYGLLISIFIIEYNKAIRSFHYYALLRTDNAKPVSLSVKPRDVRADFLLSGGMMATGRGQRRRAAEKYDVTNIDFENKPVPFLQKYLR